MEQPIEVQPLYIERTTDVFATIRNRLGRSPERILDRQQQLYVPFKDGWFVVKSFVTLDETGEEFYAGAKGWQASNGARKLDYIDFERQAGRELRAMLDSRFLINRPLDMRIREAVKQILTSQGLFLREGYLLKDGTY